MRLVGEMLARYKRVTVMGLGLFGGGLGAARYFAGLGASVTVTDSADPDKLAASVDALRGLPIRFHLGGHADEDFTTADLIVTNQAVRPDNRYLALARAAGVPIATETGLALGLNRSPWIAVTGSSGKSTTASLIAEMIRFHDPLSMFGGNIGGDLLTRIESHPPESMLTVELSSFQLTHIRDDFASGRAAPPNLAVVTNIAPNHLDWHINMDEYAQAKRNVLAFQTGNDWAVLNGEDPLLAGWASDARARVVLCRYDDPGMDNASFVRERAVCLRLGGRDVLSLSLSDFRLPGGHNVKNALQAVAAAYIMTNDADAVRKGFASFGGLPHRLQIVGPDGPRAFINDSKATTPEAAALALSAVERPCVLIAGGYDKKSPFDALAAVIQEKAAALVVVGVAGPRLADAVAATACARPENAGPLPVVDCGDDFEKAVRTAWELTPEGGAVLLSPACASYGMFVNYEQRGETFIKLAEELGSSC